MRILGLTLIAAGALFAADKAEPNQAQIDDIIQKFAAHEAEFAKARENYIYRQTARVLELDEAGNSTGRWEISGGIVAEKNSECFFCGSFVNNFRTSWIKPMSSILSASSSTKYLMCCRLIWR